MRRRAETNRPMSAAVRRTVPPCSDSQRDAEVKYAFRRSHWGRGIASEVVPAILRHARDAHGLRRVIATSDEANAASHRVLEKSGLIREGSRPEADGRMTLVHAIELERTDTD